MTIGEFATRTRLSTKALRLYDELGLVVPAQVDPTSGYRRYVDDQVEPARLVGLLRRADMPLAQISSVMALDGPAASRAIALWWLDEETRVVERRALVAYLQARLEERDHTVWEINVRRMPERGLLTFSRHVRLGETAEFFQDAFTRLRGAGPGLDGVAGFPFVVYYGEVSEDSDGPIEMCRPVADVAADQWAGEMQRRLEPAHEEAYIRLAKKDLGWPEMMPACDALERWVADQRRQVAGALRQVLIADQRTATAETPVCDLSVPLRDSRPTDR